MRSRSLEVAHRRWCGAQIWIRLVIAALAVALAGTGRAASAASDATADDPALDLPEERWTGDLVAMLQRRTIRVLVPFSRTYYWVREGRPCGAMVDVFQEFEDEINRKYHRPRASRIRVVFVPTRRDDFIPALLDGRGDIAASALAITRERRQRVDFSRPTVRHLAHIPVSGPTVPALASADDLSGRDVFLRRSSSSWERLSRLNERLVARGRAPAHLRAVPEELQDEDILELVSAGALGMTVVAAPVARLWAKLYPTLRLHPGAAVREEGELGWMMRKGSPQLAAEVNAFIRTHRPGTTFGNVLIRKWFGSTRSILGATTPQELRKFKQTVTIFRKYSQQYELHYLLMMAQGYQESRLDHGARSAVGAIGIMQVMPATGQELGVGDIHELEPNIHAGVKYVRTLQDRYFAGEPMDAFNRALFAFAAYNAGPGRVAGLRREARRKGLDPNVWFDNVEIVAAQRIGAETVGYVANILKYYTAYQVAEEDAALRREAIESIDTDAR